MSRSWYNGGESMKHIRLNTKAVLVAASLAIVGLVALAYFAFVKDRPCHLGYLKDSRVWPAFEYCNALGASHVGQEGIVAAAEAEYQLESVYVIIRHGDRQSMHGVTNYDRIDIKCEIDEEVTIHMPIMNQFKTYMAAQEGQRSSSDTFATYDVFPNKAKCGTAELTAIGASQHVRNGLLFNQRYFKALGLNNAKDVYKHVLVRSTLWSRCYQSALALMYGFLGECDLTSLKIEEAADNRMCNENTGLACKCGVMEPDVDRMASTYRQIFPDVMNKKQTVAVNQHIAKVFNIGMGDVPSVGNLYDVTMAHVCHALPLPAHNSAIDQCVQPWAIKYLHETLQENAKLQAQNDALLKVSKLKMLPLLTEITKRMRNIHDINKFVLYSGHDTTISALILALGFGDGAWPPFASRIVLELYSDKRVNEQHSKTIDSVLFVKVLFNGRAVTDRMHWCAQDLKDGLCPYTVFRRYIEKGMLESIGEDSYSTACKKSSLIK